MLGDHLQLNCKLAVKTIVLCMQTLADPVSGTKAHRRLSISSKRISPLRLPVRSLSGSLKSMQKPRPECNLNQVGANAKKIQQLHLRNSSFYLKYKSDVAAAGVSVLYVV